MTNLFPPGPNVRFESRYSSGNRHRGFRGAIYLIALAATPLVAAAGPYDPPPTYYDTATGTGATLKSQLHNIIDNHMVFSYNSARSILQITDADPNNVDHIILVYNRASLDVSGLISGVGIPGWDSGVSWNREHTWPRSRGVDSSGPDNSDLHQLRPSNPSINGSRSNLNFGGAYGQTFGSVFDGGTKWYPGDQDAGMIARQQFYMEVRYDGSDSNTNNLTLVSGNPGSGGTTLGDLDRLIEYHFAAPPDDFELRRNDVIYDSYQGNRIPFVDRPEFVWSVFVDQNNDSLITIDGAVPDPNGTTTANVNLGQVLVNAAVPAAQTVNLTKSGQDGTYYEVTTAGDATSTVTGRLNAFLTNTTDTGSLDVGLSTSTATAGQQSGTVTIDNLDITTGGGSDRGANDGNDVINVTLDVLDHANGSFASGSDQNVLNVDFGVFGQGDGPAAENHALYNLIATSGFTAALDLDSIVGSGDTAALLTDLTPSSGLAAGSNLPFTVSFDDASLGVFSAAYTLTLSDEDLAGEQTGVVMTINVDAHVALPADGNLDNVVDIGDYTLWGDNFGTGTSFTTGDYNGDGLVDIGDFTLWGDHFGDTNPGPLPSPEPASLMLAAIGALALLTRRNRR